MKPRIALMLAILLASPPRADARANQAAYVGGTIVSFNAAREPIEGRLEVGSHQLVFVPDAEPHTTAPLTIDYESIRGRELGQDQNRHLPLVVGATALLGPVGLLSLSATRRKHYLTLVYADDLAKHQVVVLELAKHVVRATLDALEARSRVEIEYQNEAARKWRR
jgi:hypothetical protein